MLRLATFLIALALPWSQALSQDYPNRAVRLVVPFAAGGPADIYARFIAQRLQDALGQSFVVENKPGGGSVIGTDQAAKSPADGYTLLVMSNTHTVNESLMTNKPFTLMKDFAPVAPINYSDLVFVVHPKTGFNSLKDLIAAAKAKPKSLNYASSGPGTPYHMAGELFKAMAGVDIQHVPYKGSSGARTDVLGGQVEMMFDAVPTMQQNIAAGKIRALAVSGRARSAVLPDVPTMAEAGVPGYEATIWLGIMAPAATPRPIIDKLNTEINKILGRADVKADWAKQGAAPMLMSVNEFTQYMRDDIEKWARIVKISGAKADQ
jgi:tripartite-type tricarboxylate transporter receptor subunit TctC